MVFLIWTFMFIPSWVFAETLTFSDCIVMLNQNNEIQAAEAVVLSKKHLLHGSQSGFFPRVSANLAYQRGNLQSSRATEDNSVQSASLIATQNLFDGFATTSELAIKNADLKNAELNLQLIKSKLSSDLRNSFATLIYAMESEKLAQNFLNRREENYRLVQLRFNNGRENKGSLLLSKAYLAQAKWDLLKARNNKVTALSELKRVLGRKDESNIDVKGSAPPLAVATEIGDYKILVAETPEYQQAIAQLESARAQVNLSKSAFFPSVNLSGQVGRYEDQRGSEKERWSIGVELIFPFFDGGKDYYSIQSARAVEISNQYHISNLEKDLETRLKKSHLSLIEAIEELKVADAFLIAATTRAEVARAKYNNGLMSFDEWDLIENDLISKSKNFLLNKKSVAYAEAAWEQVRGLGVLP